MSFAGFPDAGLIFFERLESDNSKTFWTAHRETYESQVRAPMVALLAELQPEFGAGKVFRPYRDVRFSNDKTQYKTQVAASAGPFYVQVSADGMLVGAGRYMLEPAELARLRRAVDDDVSGAQLERVLARLDAAGLGLRGDRLATRPRGCPPDHPRLDLMRLKSLAVGRSWTPQPWLHTAAAADRVRTAWRACRPLVDWLDTHVASGD